MTDSQAVAEAKLNTLGEVVYDFKQKCKETFKRLSSECPHGKHMKTGHSSHHEDVICRHPVREHSMFIEYCMISDCPFVGKGTRIAEKANIGV